MFMHKKQSLFQRMVMAMRDIKRMAECAVQCPGCGSHNVSGSGDGPYQCQNCGSMWQ